MSNYGISHSLPSWLDNRAAGVLLHPSSTRVPRIGSLGNEARRLLIFLKVRALLLANLPGWSYWI